MKGIDENTKVQGIKRHVVVDKKGFAVMVTIVNVYGKAAYLLMRGLKERYSGMKVLLAVTEDLWENGSKT